MSSEIFEQLLNSLLTPENTELHELELTSNQDSYGSWFEAD